MSRRNHFRQRQRKKYQRRSYKNPLFTKKERSTSYQKFLFPGIVVTFCLLGTFVLLRHDLFRYKHVEIIGTEYLSHELLESEITSYVDDSVKLFFRRSNQFLFSSDVLTERLQSEFALADVLVSTQEDTIYIQLAERTSNLIWISNAVAYVADLDGVISREIPNEQLTLAFNTPEGDEELVTKEIRQLRELPLFYDLNDINVSTGDVVLKPEEVENILRLHEGLDQQEIPYKRTEIDRLAGKWMRIVTVDGYGILFDALGDIDTQLANLSVVLNEQVGDRTKLEYIDLRFGDRVYFK